MGAGVNGEALEIVMELLEAVIRLNVGYVITQPSKVWDKTVWAILRNQTRVTEMNAHVSIFTNESYVIILYYVKGMHMHLFKSLSLLSLYL